MSQPCKDEVLLDDSPISTISTTDRESNISNECAHEPETLWIGGDDITLYFLFCLLIFITDIPLAATTDSLKALLLLYGKISNIQLKRSTDCEKFPLNYAFVKFEEKGSASSAYMHLTSQPELARLIVNDVTYTVRVGWAKTNSTLHIGNLDLNASVETLTEIFSKYGELASCNGEITGIVIHKSAISICYVNSCYATVTFTSREAAEEARIATNGITINKKPIKVDWNKKKKSSAEPTAAPDRYSSQLSAVPKDLWQHPSMQLSAALPRSSGSEVISIYVQWEALNDKATRVTEAFLKRLFLPFGSLTGCYIKARNHVEETGGERGYAFIHFENSFIGQSCARTAVAVIGIHGHFVYEGVCIKAEVSKNFCRATGPADGGLYYAPPATFAPMMVPLPMPVPEDSSSYIGEPAACDEFGYPAADGVRYIYVNDVSGRFVNPYFEQQQQQKQARVGDMGTVMYQMSHGGMGVDQNAGCIYPPMHGGQFYLPFYGECGVVPVANFPTHSVQYAAARR